jgi:hypothetical protein
VRGSSGRVGIVSGVLKGGVASGLGVVLATCALAGGATLPASASAAVALDAPGNAEPPLIAYDPSTQTTYVAWSDPVLLGVDLCVLPSGSTTCEGGAPVVLEDDNYSGWSTNNHPGLGGLVVLPGGEAVVLGAPVSTGTVAWASPAGGAAFLTGNHGLQNGGNFISPVSLYRNPADAAALSSSEVGLLDQYGGEGYFSDSPLTSESPSIASYNSDAGGQYPLKGGDGPDLAAEAAPAPAAAGTEIVVGVGSNADKNQSQPLGCSNYAASGYGVSVGKLDGTSKTSGTLNQMGLPKFGLLGCSANETVLAQGGQDGIGVLEQEGSGISGEGSDYTIDYRPFDANSTGGTFGAPVELADVTAEVLDGVDQLDLSEDSSTGVYALWESGKAVLDYSGNGGATWDGPVVSPVPYSAKGVIAGTGGGGAEIAYPYNTGSGEQVFIEPVNYQTLAAPTPTTIITPPAYVPPPLATTITTTQFGGGVSGASLTVPQGTPVADQAHLFGTNAASATGTVTYNIYKNSKCTVAAGAGSVASVVNGVPGASAPVKLGADTYYWQVSYSGNATNTASTSACGSEVLVVALNATTLGLPSSKMCLSKRAFVVHPRAPHGVKLVSVEVQINGKFIKRVKLSSHGGTPVSLVGLPKGTFKIALITKSSKGKIYEEVRTFHTCVPKKHKKK